MVDGTWCSWTLSTNDDESRSSPTQVGTDSNWASVTGGRYWGGGLKTDGTLYVWGVNHQGQLGQNSRLPSDNTGYSSPAQIPGTWSHIRGQNGGFFGGKSDGTLWGWGGNYNGGLGQNDESQSLSSPTQVGSGNTWESVSVNTTCMLGLRS